MKQWFLTYKIDGVLFSAVTMAETAEQARGFVEAHHYKRGTSTPEWVEPWKARPQGAGYVHAAPKTEWNRL